MEALLCNLVCAGSPFLEHSSGLRVFFGVFFVFFFLGVPNLECFLACFSTRVCSHPLNQGWLHGCVSCAIIQGPTLRFGCGYSLEISHKVIFEFVFCKQSLMTLTAEYTHTHTHTHTHTRIHNPACGQSRQCAEGTARPRSKLRLVPVVVAAAGALMAALATAPEKGEAPRGSRGSLVKPPEPVWALGWELPLLRQ